MKIARYESELGDPVYCTDGKFRYEYEMEPVSAQVWQPLRLAGFYTFNNLYEFKTELLDLFKMNPKKSFYVLENIIRQGYIQVMLGRSMGMIVRINE